MAEGNETSDVWGPNSGHRRGRAVRHGRAARKPCQTLGLSPRYCGIHRRSRIGANLKCAGDWMRHGRGIAGTGRWPTPRRPLGAPGSPPSAWDLPDKLDHHCPQLHSLIAHQIAHSQPLSIDLRTRPARNVGRIDILHISRARNDEKPVPFRVHWWRWLRSTG